MHISITISEDEYIEAFLLHFKSQTIRRIALGFILVIFVMLLWKSGHINIGGVIGGIIGLIITWIASYMLWKRKLLKHYIQSKDISDSCELTISDNNMNIKTINANIDYKLNDVKIIKENKNLLLLYITNVQFIIVPKRIVGTEKDINSFKKSFTG